MTWEEALERYGLTGAAVVVLGFVVRYLFQKVEAHSASETQRANRNEAALLAALSVNTEKVIPAVRDMMDAYTKMVEVTAQLKAILESERTRERP